jgi:hypothetical protein
VTSNYFYTTLPLVLSKCAQGAAEARKFAYTSRSGSLLVGRVAASGGTLRRMPLELSLAELETAARACRAMAYQESEHAKKMENPSTRGPVEAMARRYAELAAKLEAARKLRAVG